MFVDELPSLRVLLLSQARCVCTRGIRGGIAARNKIDDRALEVSASIALKGITRDYKSLT